MQCTHINTNTNEYNAPLTWAVRQSEAAPLIMWPSIRFSIMLMEHRHSIALPNAKYQERMR